MKDLSLSSKIHRNAYEDTTDLPDLLDVPDVKEFITKIINEIEGYNDSSFMLSPIIDKIKKLAGSELYG